MLQQNTNTIAISRIVQANYPQATVTFLFLPQITSHYLHARPLSALTMTECGYKVGWRSVEVGALGPQRLTAQRHRRASGQRPTRLRCVSDAAAPPRGPAPFATAAPPEAPASRLANLSQFTVMYCDCLQQLSILKCSSGGKYWRLRGILQREGQRSKYFTSSFWSVKFWKWA